MKASLRDKLATHFVACSAAAIGACAISAPEARAAVVYYQPNGGAGWAIPATSAGLYINVETQAADTNVSNVTGWDLNPFSSYILAWWAGGGLTLPPMLRYPGVTDGSAGSLDIGTIVDASGSYGGGNVVVGSGNGEWKLNSPNYFGFQFVAADGFTHYGWGRMDVGAELTTRSIMEIGYEDVAGVGIPVLASASVSVPGPLPLFGAAAAFGWSRRLRRRSLRLPARRQADLRSRPHTLSA